MNGTLRNGGSPGAASGKKNLVLTLAETLRKAILRGDYAIGDKLPSEATLTGQFDVSRTVVREAIAALRSDGLVVARQGAGVFVVADQINGSSAFEGVDPKRLSSILEVLELRIAVEVEAAGLAALRRSPAQEDAIYQRLSELDAAFACGEPTTAADLAFHLTIADATNNPKFRSFLEMLGSDAIPRGRLAKDGGDTTSSEYLALLQAEHHRVADSIAAGDARAARQAMREHLLGGQARYKRMLREIQR
jgi:DNA-binding FadR family transcriptional regulator